MDKLEHDLDRLIDKLSNSENFERKLETLQSVYPFNKFEYIISFLLAGKGL